MSSFAAGSTASSSSSTSSSRCVPFAFRRGTAPGAGRAPAAPAGGCGRPLCCACKGIQSAFFVSLDVCGCVKLPPTDSFRFRGSESDTARLMPPPPLPSSPPPKDAAARRMASTGGKPRRGLGCCTPKSTSVN